ncbi:MAG: MBL fold metallo-hydrolase [Chloroflexi bacterium]|nr:MBL fold metallo-hydrolase [Chloroflexota bacterium]
MQVVFKRGVYLPELDLWLDSLRQRETSLISHAHSDHTARHRRPILTPNTRLLLSDYLRKCDPVTVEYREPLDSGDYTLTLYPAGHCLGSAQALVKSKATGERVLYTGDIKVRPSPTNEPLEIVQCDTLIMEATYGRPRYTFPGQEQVMSTAFKTLHTWLERGEKPVVQGWRLGKAQEVLHHLLAEGFDVLVEESIYSVAQVYQEAGVGFPGGFRPFDGQWPEGSVLLCPPGRRSTGAVNGFRGLRFMELTGWAVDGGNRWGRPPDASLPFSDHPDFNELVDFVRRVQPKQVYTVNGFPELAAHLRGLGYPAVHLDGKTELQDTGFQMKLL